MSEVTNNEIMETEEVKDNDLTIIDLDAEDGESGNGSVVKVVLGLAAAGAAVAGALYVCKDKIAEHRKKRMIQKLEKEGYTVFEPDVVKEVVDVDDCEEESEETE